MTIALRKGCYRARLAAGPADVTACQRLRRLCFHGQAGADADRFDPACQHVMVEDAGGRLVATARVALWPDGAVMLRGYAAQFYDLSGLAQVPGPMAELGRFCTDPAICDADVLRVIWGALTQLVDSVGARHLLGCSSFAGTDPMPYDAAFALLAARHSGPDGLRPGVKAQEVIPLAAQPVDVKAGLRQMPALLRSYLTMGGWVSDHAVVDRNLQTLHVFTCVPVAAIPAARVRALRAVAG